MNLSINNLSVHLSGKEIIKSINFSASDKQFVSVLGASGCGKSTLLKAISGILPLSSGFILLDGKVVNHLPPHKRNISVVFQDLRLFPHMTVFENIAFPLKVRGASHKEYHRAILEILDLVQLSGFDHRKPHELSGGQQQRVALARALVAKPNLLLLDEPFSGLDESLRDEMRKLVKDLHTTFQMTTILVTHDKGEALGMSDKIVLLSQGSVLQEGSPKDLFESPNSCQVATYFGSASFVSGKVTNGQFNSTLFCFPSSKEDGNYKAIIRPYALKAISGHNFKVVRLNYIGNAVESTFLHMETNQTIEVVLDSDCQFRIGDEASIMADNTKIKLVPDIQN